MDLPNQGKFLYHWHQDISYSLAAFNSITYWIPLTDVGIDSSTIKLIPGSHKQGIYPFEYKGQDQLLLNKVMSPKDIIVEDGPRDTPVKIEAINGDLVVFSQPLLHMSKQNRSVNSRWTIQIRHSDVDNKYIKAGCPLGFKTNIYDF